MAHVSAARPRRNRGHGPLFAPLMLFLIVAAAAAAYVAYVLWPRWPTETVSLQAPALPIVVGGEMFNIEPAAIRRDVQRRAGTQQRVDLEYVWPALTPPDPVAQLDAARPIDPNERLFVTVAQADAALAPIERIKTIYPRYLAEAVTAQPDGLAIRGFRDGTPYRGEDLIYDAAAPEAFVARCTRTGVGNGGVCLDERRIGHADITMRFPRDWLADWKGVSDRLDRLMLRLHPG